MGKLLTHTTNQTLRSSRAKPILFGFFAKSGKATQRQKNFGAARKNTVSSMKLMKMRKRSYMQRTSSIHRMKFLENWKIGDLIVVQHSVVFKMSRLWIKLQTMTTTTRCLVRRKWIKRLWSFWTTRLTGICQMSSSTIKASRSTLKMTGTALQKMIFCQWVALLTMMSLCGQI